jgi:hypothetical protein
MHGACRKAMADAVETGIVRKALDAKLTAGRVS